MSDPLDGVRLLEGMAAAAGAAALLLVLFSWPRRASRPSMALMGSAVGTGVGFLIGCWVFGIHPQWPPRQDQDRLLLILLPSIVAVEALAAASGSFRRRAWVPRLLLAGGAAPIVLYDSVYLRGAEGFAPSWTTSERWFMLVTLAAALAGVWGALVLLTRRSPHRILPLVIALCAAGAAITIMLSGYATGGPIGLALGAALGGATLASFFLQGPPNDAGSIGVGIVGLFGLLLCGHFFGELTTLNAVLLFCAPLLCWFADPLFPRGGRPILRGFLRAALPLAPVLLALSLAYSHFAP